MNDFIQFVTETASPHPDAAWKAWQHQQREIDRLRAEVMALREHNEHLEQQVFEAQARLPRLRLINSAA